jgi:phosphonate transport system ATP-binding protein
VTRGPDAVPRPLAAPAGEPAASLRGAARRFGQAFALGPVDLEVRAGERLAVVGPSGAGKTTLLRLLNTSLAPSEGRVEVLGADPARVSASALRRLRARIGTVHQQLHLVTQASVLQNVVAGRLGRRTLLGALGALVSRREVAEVGALLEGVGIADKILERVDRLSGGEQQRVAIARTLHQAPELVLADEPFSSVDPARAAGIAALLARAFAGRTFVVSTHRIEPLLPHVDRVVGLRGGTIAFDVPTERLRLADLAHLYRARAGEGGRSASRAAPARGDLPAGLLRIAASNTPSEVLLPAAIRRFARGYPGVRLALVQAGSAAVQEAVRSGSAEIGFVGARTPDPVLEVVDVAEDEIVVVAAPALALGDEPLSAPDLARLPRVDREPGSGTAAVAAEHLANMGVVLEPGTAALEAGSLAALRAAAVSGVGIAFVSRRAVEDELATGSLRIVAVQGLSIPRSFCAVHRREPGLSPAARAFLEVVRASALGSHR